MRICVVAPLLCVCVVLFTSSAPAHPARGIVVGKEGRIHFLGPGPAFQLWSIEPDGKLGRPRATGIVGPHHLAIDPAGNLYLAGAYPVQLIRLSANGGLTTAYPPRGKKRGTANLGSGVQSPVLVDGKGAIYFVETRGGATEWCRIMKVAPDDSVTLVAGSVCGHADGKRENAQFRRLDSGTMTWGPDGSIYVTDAGTCVRRIKRDGNVTTLAGSTEEGYADGQGSMARFKLATGVVVDKTGTVYVVDQGNFRIRKIAPDGAVETLAGSGKKGTADGSALKATFRRPTGIARDENGALYILDGRGTSSLVRKILNGNVKTVAVVDE